MTSQPLPEAFDDARWLVQAIDPRARLARLVEMDAAAYRAASFLDDRMMADKPASRLVALEALLEAGLAMPSDVSGWIFHIGHVGSTLVSRLLGELPAVLALREPRSLRDLTMFDESERAAAASALSRLMGRSLAPGDRTIVKATSFVSELAPLLTGPEARALFLYATPRNYVASILAGPNSTIELKALEEPRRQRLAARGVMLGALPTDAHRAAAAWLTEMLSLEAAASSVGARALWFDFDRMLDDMPSALASAVNHFGISADTAQLCTIAEGPLMSRYSKALEFDYSPSLRRDLLAEAMAQHGRDVDQALGWLHDVVGRLPAAAALNQRMA